MIACSALVGVLYRSPGSEDKQLARVGSGTQGHEDDRSGSALPSFPVRSVGGKGGFVRDLGSSPVKGDDPLTGTGYTNQKEANHV